MKTVRLFIVALFLTVAASAQPNAASARDGSSPTVYMISVQETDTLIPEILKMEQQMVLEYVKGEAMKETFRG